MVTKMKYKMFTVFVCISLVMVCIPAVGGRNEGSSSSSSAIDAPHLDFLAGPDSIGWEITLWNFGTKPAFFIRWKIETEGVNGTQVIGGNRQGIILYLRSMDSQYLLPGTLPITKLIQPVGRGEIRITVTIFCRNAGYDVTYTSHWMLDGLKVYAIMHPW